jgi:hypothetical protein
MLLVKYSVTIRIANLPLLHSDDLVNGSKCFENLQDLLDYLPRRF